MNNIFFINEQYIKNNSEIQNDVDIKKMKRSIQLVQLTFVQKLVGTALYKDICDKIQNNSLSTDYQELLETYLQPITLELTLYKSLPFLSYTLTNKNIYQKESDNNRSIELDDIKFLQSMFKDSADFLSQQCILYLNQKVNNENKFPLYKSSENYQNLDYMTPEPDDSQPYYYGGIYLGDVDDFDINPDCTRFRTL